MDSKISKTEAFFNAINEESMKNRVDIITEANRMKAQATEEATAQAKKLYNEKFAQEKAKINKKAGTVISVKERTGEARAASAALAAMHGALLLSGELKESDAYLISGDKKQKTTVKGEKLNNILAISFGSGGSYCALVITK